MKSSPYGIIRLRVLTSLTILLMSSTDGFSSVEENMWTTNTAPEKFLFDDEKLDKNFSRLKLEATVNEVDGHTPWSDDYWAGFRGGIAFRYQDPKKESAFSYLPYRKETLLNMKPEQISILSAAEKFDILRGSYDYPLLKRVRKTYSPKVESWVGICHGWTPAAANFPEPKAVTIINADGIVIPFGSSDVKAIISFYYAWEASQYRDDGVQNFGWDKNNKYFQRDENMIYFLYRGIGDRTHSKKEGNSGNIDNRKDLNAATVHILLTNLIGKYHRSFNADVDKGAEVWNQPLYGYKSTIVETSGKEVLVRTELKYISEVYPDVAPHGDKQRIESKVLQYWLTLDDQKNIIAGRWVAPFLGIFGGKKRKTDLLDFIWRASRVPFLGEFNAINDIYKTDSKTVSSYAMGPGYTPGLIDVDGEEIIK